MVTEESNAGTLVGKARKGKTFVVEDEKQVCRFVLHVSQDLITWNGQKNQVFWEQITTRYNKNCPTFYREHPARSLEIKWGLIKHDVTKFCGNYQTIVALNESGTSSEDTLQKALELFKSKYPK
jgi:hypothetical protein